jgi:GNAT superfamily N-acetyltransferase
MPVMPTETGNDGALLARFGAAHRAAVRAEWSAAMAAGLEMWINEDGGLLLGAAPSISSAMFNRGLGFTEQPDRTDVALTFFADHGVVGDIVLDPADAPPTIEPRLRLDVHVAEPDRVATEETSDLAIRVVVDEEIDAWMELVIDANAPSPEVAVIWRSMAAHVGRTPDWTLIAGWTNGRMVAAASLFTTGGIGWQSWASVLPAARGHGFQRALIAARTRLAVEAGCDIVAAWALAGAHSSDNLVRAGLPRIGQRVVVRASDLG